MTSLILKQAQSAGPGIIEILLVTENEETGLNTQPDAIDVSVANYRINGSPPAAISRWSVPSDEGRAITNVQPNRFPVQVTHHLFLQLGHPLQEGAVYVISTPYGDTSLAFDSRATNASCLKVNQVGYSERTTSRFAVFGVYLGDGGSRRMTPFPHYDVVDEVRGTVVFSGMASVEFDDTLVNDTSPTSGEWVYHLPLSQVPVGGPYFVSVPGCGRSRSFGVGQAYTRRAAYVATRGLYHQRCGIALDSLHTDYTRGICHTRIADTRVSYPGNGFINVPSGAAMTAIQGGYHDAGDFQRRPTHTLTPLLMLTVFEAWPSHFVDQQYNLPESGNGRPDFLDEALWGLLLWENLQIMTAGDPKQGGVRGGTQRDAEPTYGVHSAASDPGVYGTWDVLEEVTAFACGMFAQASRLVRPYDSARADALLNRARMAWAYLQRTTNVNQAATRFMYPALQLYLTTGEQPFHDLFRAAAQAVVVVGSWPEQYLPGNVAANCLTAHFVGYLLPTALATDVTLATALKAKILAGAASGGYMNVNTEGSPYDEGVNKFYSWGSMTAQGRYAEVYMFATLFEPDATKRQSYLNTVSELSDYSLGLNPMSRSFYTGLGADSPNSPGHLDSYWTKYGLSDGVTSDHVGKPIGNVPGILVFGPTSGPSGQSYQLAVSQKLYPGWESLPIQRRYGDGWSLLNSNEFSVWETIVWNVIMLGFLDDAPQAAPPPPLPPPSTNGLQLTAAQTDSLRRVTAVIGDLGVLRDALAAQK